MANQEDRVRMEEGDGDSRERNDQLQWMMDYIVYTLIVDDIVHPDGTTAMACLGGGGPQTAFGIRLWAPSNARVGLAAGVGSDLPESCRTWLEESHVDTAGLIAWPLPTLRAWQLFEADGRRTQVWRVPLLNDVWSMLRPSVTTLPIAFRNSRAYHVGVHPSGQDVSFIRGLRATNAEVVSIEPYTRATDIVPRSELEALLSSAHIFSPNEEEAWSMVGPGSPEDVIGRLVELGGQVVCLRRGPHGAVVHSAATGETWEIPAFYTAFGSQTRPSSEENSASFKAAEDTSLSMSVEEGDDASSKHREPASEQGFASTEEVAVQLAGVKDQTGCGNAFCGGFLVGWVTTGDLQLAGLWASVAASFMIEYEGVPPPSSSRRREAELRMAMLQPLARRLDYGKLVAPL